MQIRRTIVIISELVDSTIKEYQPDVEFLIFRSIEELSNYIQTTPIRADSLYFTRDTIPDSSLNTNLTFLMSMLENPFLGVNDIFYLTEHGSPEAETVEFIIETHNLSNWKVLEGSLTREYITNVINGTLRSDDFKPHKKVVVRMGKEAYYREMREKQKSLDETYDSDEDYLGDIPDEEPPYEITPDRDVPCEVKHILGIDCAERTAFAFLCAQYLSLSGKTVILERDVEYHRLGEYVTKSEIDCMIVQIEDLLENPIITIDRIKKSDKSLICVVTFKRIKYSYIFIANILINNLLENIAYFVEEDIFEEVPDDIEATLVIPANILGLLKTTENVDRNYIGKLNFVGVNLGYLQETCIPSSESLATLLRDILENNDIESVVVSIESLHLKGEPYDLKPIFK